MKVRHNLKLAVIVLLLFILPLALLISSSTSAPDSPADMTPQPMAINQQLAAPSPSASPTPPQPADGTPKLIIGDPNAPVTLVDYGDFQCPFCAQFFEQTAPSISRDYVDTGKVRIEFRVETHIGRESVRAGEAAYCANDQQTFRAYHDELYRRQNGENNGAFSDNNLKKIAQDLRLDRQAFDDCLDSGKYLDTVQASNAEARNRGVTSTPTIFIGDNKVVGAQPYAIYKTLLDEQL